MEPFLLNNQTVLASSVPFIFSKPKIGDVVAFRYQNKHFIKRISKIKDDSYFLEGDNKEDSLDSRKIGWAKREDIIGKLGVCMAPHNCAGVICRFIGFSNTLALFASPYMHAAMRRDCDGDEAALMLLADVLINFSR